MICFRASLFSLSGNAIVLYKPRFLLINSEIVRNDNDLLWTGSNLLRGEFDLLSKRSDSLQIYFVS
jgi:hypothetical protein